MALDIKLGAPETIEGGANRKATISVQNMMRLKELTLADGATEEGSIVTAGRLLAQLKAEEEMPISDNLRIDVKPIGSDTIAIGCTGCELQAYKDGVEINVQFVVEGIENIASVDKNVITFNNTSVAKFIAYFFLNGEKYAAYHIINSGEDYSRYAYRLAEWPDLINSLVDTGKRNVITQETNSDAGLINSGIVCSADMSFRAVVKPHIINNINYIFGGGGSTSTNKMYQSFNLNGTNGRTYMRYSSPENNKTDAEILGNWGEYKFDISSYSVLGVTTPRPANISSFVVKETAPIYIFGGMFDDNGTSYTRNSGVGNTLSIEVLEIRKDSEQHIFVPFVHNNEAGMLDLFDLSFHGNAYTSGSFTITTEDKQ